MVVRACGGWLVMSNLPGTHRGSRPALGTAAVRVVAMALELSVALVLARVLVPAEFGVFAFAMSAIQVLAVFASFGNPLLATRHVSQGLALEDHASVTRFLQFANRSLRLLSALWPLLAVSAAYTLNVLDSAHNVVLVAALLLALPPLAYGRFYAGCIAGASLVSRSQVPEYVVRPLLFIVLTAIYALGRETRPDARELAVAFLMASIVAFFLSRWWAIKALPLLVTRNDTANCKYKELTKGAWLLTIFGGLQVLGAQIDTLIVGLYLPPEDVASYRLAYQVMSAAGFALTVVNLVYAPRFARLYAIDDLTGMQRLANECARVAVAGVLPTLALLFFYGRPLCELVFGPAYSATANLAVILLIGLLVNALTASVAVVLNMSGHERETVWASFGQVLLVLLLCFALIPRYEAEGAAIAASTALIARNVYLYLRMVRLLGIRAFII